MRVLLLGATGLIGAAVLARLTQAGHDVTAVARRRGPQLRRVRWIELDIAQLTSPEHWRDALTAVEAVINCAGALQDGGRDDLRGVHVAAVAALCRACEAFGVPRLVHVSAIGADRAPVTPFSATKQEGERALEACNLDWVILRPAVVVGRGAFGGSALIRGLAGLPFEVSLAGTGPMQLVDLDDLAATIEWCIAPGAPSRRALDVAAPERLELADVVLAYRRWLGFSEAPRLTVPRAAGRLLARLGDFARMLGWRPAITSTARAELERGVLGDPRAWLELTGIEARPLAARLAEEPASVQERWFARLYFAKPLMLVVLAAFWILTGLISLGPGWERGLEYLLAGGVPGAVAAGGVVAGALADVAIGIGIAFRRTARRALQAALAISVFYMAAGTVVLPALWADPVGPMLKIWPILVLNVVALAVLPER